MITQTTAIGGRDITGHRAGGRGRAGREGERAVQGNCAIALVIFLQRGVMT